jgi:hypothetical protein
MPLDHFKQNPELVPPFLNVTELEVDVKAVESLRLLYQPLLQLTEAFGDTMTLSGSEAYSEALTFYSSVKSAKKSKIAYAFSIISI